MPRPALRHVDPRAPRSALYRAYVRVVDTPVVAWVSRHIGWKLDPVLLRVSGGRVGLGLLLPTALLETRGARTGDTRRNAVIYFHDSERVVLVASNIGLPRHPAWFHNARANPDVRVNGLSFRAEVVADEAERARLFALADLVFPPYARYRDKTAAVGRSIPILQLLQR